MDRGGSKAAEKLKTPLRSVHEVVSELRAPIKAGLEAARLGSTTFQFDGTAHQISTLQSKHRELEGLLHAKDAELMTLNHKTDQLTNDFLYNLKLLEQRDKEIETLESADEELKMTLAAKEVLLTKSQHRVNELELEVAQLQEQKSRAEEHFRKELHDAQLQFQQEQHKLGEDVNRMQVAIQETQSRYANDIQQERESASKEREALLMNYEAQIKESKNSEAVAADLRQKLSVAEGQVESGNVELQVALDKLQGAILEIGELEKKHKKTCHESQSLLRAKEEEIQDLHNALEAEKRQLEVEGKELLEKTTKANERNKKLQRLCEQQSQQLSKNTVEQKQQMEEKKKLRQKLKEVQEELDELKEEKLSLQETLHHQLSQQEESEKSLHGFKSKQEAMERENEAMRLEVMELRSRLTEKSKEVDLKREKLRSTEEDYRRERKQRHALQRQLASCLEEKENHHKQKMDQILLALKKEKSTSWSLLDAAELRGRNAEKELEIVKKRIEQSWEKRCKSPQPVSPRRSLATPPPAEPMQANRTPICTSHEYLLNRTPTTPISEHLATSPKKQEPGDNLLQDTFELLQTLVEKIDGGEASATTKAPCLVSDRKTPRQAAAAAAAASLANSPGCRSRLSHQHAERDSDHLSERLNRVVGLGSSEDKEMQKAIKKLHKERKKLIEKQKDVDAAGCRGGAAPSAENDQQSQIEFLKLRSEQLSEENGRLRYQLAATSNGEATGNSTSTVLPQPQPSRDPILSPAPSFGRSFETNFLHPMEPFTRLSKTPPVSESTPEKRSVGADERNFKRESGLERAKSKILRAKEQLRKAGK